MGQHAIEVEGLSKRYFLGEDHVGVRNLRETLMAGLRRGARTRAARAEVWSLRDVTFEVPEGEAFGVIGRNGAGKSTLLKILSRITEPTEGVARTRGRVGSLLEVGTGFHPELTGRENVFLNGAILGMGRRAIERTFDEIVDFAGVHEFLDTPVKRYSSGMYLRLAFAVAAHLDAEILLVDEVLAVGDAEFQRKCLGRMASVEREGRTVVFVSHNLDAVVRLCPACLWLDQGSIVALGPAAEVVDRYLSAGVQRLDRQTFEGDPDALVSLRSVGVMNAQGECSSVLRRDEPFVIEVSFVVRQPVNDLNVAVSIQTLRGLRVLDEALSDHSPSTLFPPGEYVARLAIPSLLNAGDYVVGVWVGTNFETFAWVEEALSLHLEGGVNGRPDRVVQLRLPWDVRPRVDAAVAGLGRTEGQGGAPSRPGSSARNSRGYGWRNA
ncbi:MAG: ABC transporter ATP-binding protein [Actinomycetota bacterium]|nr:ABC transporter ATP-binding protein [Actinomycetota bacterium]